MDSKVARLKIVRMLERENANIQQGYLKREVLRRFLEIFDQLQIEIWNHCQHPDVLSMFDYQFIFEWLELNELRMRFVQDHKDSEATCFFNFTSDQFVDLNIHQPVLVVLSKDYLNNSQNNAIFQSQESLKIIMAMAPYAGKDWKTLFQKFKLQQWMNVDNVHFLVDRESLEQNKYLSELLENSNLANVIAQKGKSRLHILDTLLAPIALAEKQRYHSPSAHQLYLDCPRKYLLDRITKTTPLLDSELEVSPREKGVFLDQLLATKYVEIFKGTFLRENLLEEFNLFFSAKKYSVLKREYLLQECERNIDQIRIFLLELNEYIAISNWKFKERYQSPSYHFEIDFLAEDHIRKRVVIIDLKRSAYSIPSGNEIEQLDSIQLPYYLWYYSEIAKSKAVAMDEVSFLYLCASEVSEARGMSWSTLAQTKLKSVKWKSSQQSLEQYLNQVEKKFSLTKQKINEDQTFLQVPRKINTCDYCNYSPLCMKRSPEAANE
jgi:hypothetical protein